MDIKPVGLFAGMSDSDLKKIGKQMREVRHPKGTKPVLRGKDGVGFMVILDGQAEVSTVDGRHRILGPGDHFGEMALLDQQGRSADITARTDMVSAAIPEWEFREFLGNHPEVAYRLLQTLSQRLREAEEAIGTR